MQKVKYYFKTSESALAIVYWMTKPKFIEKQRDMQNYFLVKTLLNTRYNLVVIKTNNNKLS